MKRTALIKYKTDSNMNYSLVIVQQNAVKVVLQETNKIIHGHLPLFIITTVPLINSKRSASRGAHYHKIVHYNHIPDQKVYELSQTGYRLKRQ